MYVVHFILKNKLMDKRAISHIPSVGDEVRYGIEGKEKFYKVIRRVWCVDEIRHDNPVRVNIELKKI